MSCFWIRLLQGFSIFSFFSKAVCREKVKLSWFFHKKNPKGVLVVTAGMTVLSSILWRKKTAEQIKSPSPCRNQTQKILVPKSTRYHLKVGGGWNVIGLKVWEPWLTHASVLQPPIIQSKGRGGGDSDFTTDCFFFGSCETCHGDGMGRFPDWLWERENMGETFEWIATC